MHGKRFEMQKNGGMLIMKQQLIEKFGEIFGSSEGVEVYFAPGRVNLIGEHTDYNGGHVFPCALTLGTYAAVRKREDNQLNFYSMNFDKLGVISSSLEDLNPSKEAGWTNYPKGVMWAFEGRGMKMTSGLDMVIYGNIPNGSGLSSSASLEVLTGFVLKNLYGFTVSNVEIAQIGQYSENNFNGCNCGIMDQFASAMGKENHAIFLDTADLSFEYAPLKLDGMKIVVTNSKVKHSLVDSAYNDRRSACETALADLQQVCGISALGELNEAEFEAAKNSIKDFDNRTKAKHAVYENQRSLKAVAALKENDLVSFGKLMNESHISLRDDYEVSCEEIDTLVDAAWTVDGVLGSRITGGGFGGCTVSIVREDSIDNFKQTLTAAYKTAYEKEPEFYVVEAGEGPQKL